MTPQFDHEKLDVYQLELRFITWVTTLLVRIKQRPSEARTGEISDQLDRASLSALLNTAEGNGKRQRQTRAKFFDDARGSATECAACLDALVAKGLCPSEEVLEGKGMLVRIAAMLSKLVARFDSYSDSILREEPGEFTEDSFSSSSSFSSSILRKDAADAGFEDEKVEDEEVEDEDDKKREDEKEGRP